MKYSIILLLLIVSLSNLSAQETLSLEQCRQKALEANKGLKMAEEKRIENENLQKVAFWQMLPKVGATGGYTWMEKSVQLLSDDQKDRLNNLGNNVQEGVEQAIREETSSIPFVGDLIGDALSNVLNNTNSEWCGTRHLQRFGN